MFAVSQRTMDVIGFGLGTVREFLFSKELIACYAASVGYIRFECTFEFVFCYFFEIDKMISLAVVFSVCTRINRFVCM